MFTLDGEDGQAMASTGPVAAQKMGHPKEFIHIRNKTDPLLPEKPLVNSMRTGHGADDTERII